jgi:hypothetical protein
MNATEVFPECAADDGRWRGEGEEVFADGGVGSSKPITAVHTRCVVVC